MILMTKNPAPTPRIRSVSFSRLLVYRECPYRAYLAFIERRKENERPIVDGVEPANERGERIHKAGEDFVRGNTPELIPEWDLFTDELERARLLFLSDQVIAETLWCFNDTWQPTTTDDRDSPWINRIIIDLFVFKNSHTALLVDYKSGKSRFNEFKHSQQLEYYCVAAFQKFPNLKTIHGEIWYTDEGIVRPLTMRRHRFGHYFRIWSQHTKSMLWDTEFKPKPNKQTCRFCPYQTGSNRWIEGTGDCGANPDTN